MAVLTKTGEPASQNVRMEEVHSCPICLNSGTDFITWNFDRLYGFPGKFGLIQCTDCGLVRLSPRPNLNQIQNYYPQDDYYSYQVADGSIKDVTERTYLGNIRDRMREVVFDSMGYTVRRLGFVEKLLQPIIVKTFFKRATFGWGNKFPRNVAGGTALDVGSGNGRYLSFLKNWGWNVKGIDFSQTASDFAKKEFDIDVHVGTFEDAPFAPDSFDYINLSHVVEHTFDPVKTLELVREFLKPGGTAYIEVPNYESFSRKRSGSYWYPWETPRHVFMFSPQNLRLLVEKVGLSVVRVKTENGNFWPWDKTYKLEEKYGSKLEVRPAKRLQDKPELTALRVLSSLNLKFRPLSGDFICMWVRK